MTTLIVFYVVAFICSFVSANDCPPHQTYKQCAKVCVKTCETQYLNLLYACRCQPGCECDEDYISDGKGNCILPKDCDPKVVKCPENMEYSKCKNKEVTCSGVQKYNCKPGCYCTNSFVLNNNGDCVNYRDC